jgi:hypothetical protein
VDPHHDWSRGSINTRQPAAILTAFENDHFDTHQRTTYTRDGHEWSTAT